MKNRNFRRIVIAMVISSAGVYGFWAYFKQYFYSVEDFLHGNAPSLFGIDTGYAAHGAK